MLNNRTYTTQFDEGKFSVLALLRSVEQASDGIYADDAIAPYAYERKAEGNFTIPDGVRHVGYRAFAACEKLYSIYIPKSVESMASPFDGCVNLTHIYFGGSRKAWNRLVSGWRLADTGSDALTVYCAEEDEGGRAYDIRRRHVCPVCGKTLFPDENSLDQCTHCGWEDDGNAEREPFSEENANGVSLQTYRAAYAKKCAQDREYHWWTELKKGFLQGEM